jgi:hypothetical protein
VTPHPGTAPSGTASGEAEVSAGNVIRTGRPARALAPPQAAILERR